MAAPVPLWSAGTVVEVGPEAAYAVADALDGGAVANNSETN